MKKVFLIAATLLMVLSSCNKTEGVDLIKQLPELKGEWLWRQTTVGGVVGYVLADDDKPLVIDLKGHNTLSIKYNDETIVRNASYSCEETPDSPYGKYLITLPKEVRTIVAEAMGISEIVVDGYLYLDDAVDLSEPCLTLFITDRDGRNVGYEGGEDYHFCSCFVPNRIVLH